MYASYDPLYDIADLQQGFFTAKQAMQCGYHSKHHSYFVRKGEWIREYRGVYRLAKYPLAERPDLMKWYLWSRGRDDIPKAVFSHDTALDLYEICDILPSKIHMTVPPRFRKSCVIPKVLVLYKEIVATEDTQEFFSVKVTTPCRTIIDLLERGDLAKDLMIQACSNALEKGLIVDRSALLNHAKCQQSRNLKKTLNNILEVL